MIDGARAVVENYRPHIPIDPTWPMVMISDICDLIGGSTPSRKEPSYWNNAEVKWISSKHINEIGVIKSHELISNKALKDKTTKVVPPNSTIIITRVSVGKYAITDDYYAINQDLTALVPREKVVLPEYIYRIAPRVAEIVEQKAEGIGVRGVTREFLSNVNIPLPPLETQKALVAEIENEQTLVNANCELIEQFEKKIGKTINRVWGEE